MLRSIAERVLQGRSQEPRCTCAMCGVDMEQRMVDGDVPLCPECEMETDLERYTGWLVELAGRFEHARHR